MAAILARNARCRFKPFFEKKINFIKHSTITQNTANSIENVYSNLYDVVISGGGIIGACLAVVLGQQAAFQGKQILLLEGQQKNEVWSPSEPINSRTCALSPATVKLLTGIGAWDNIQNMRMKEVKRMQVWDSSSDSMITFNQDDLTENLAYIVENKVIADAITQQFSTISDSVEVRYQSKVKSYRFPFSNTKHSEQNDKWVTINLDNDETIHSKLLIGADGYSSLVRESAGIHSAKWDYHQNAVIATLHLAQDFDNNVAWQRFLPTGPIAMLPVSNEHSCLIWTTSPERAKNLLQLSTESFVDAVNSAFWSDDEKNSLAQSLSKSFDDVLTSIGFDGSTSKQLPPTVVGVDGSSRAMFPLGLGHATHYVKPRIALIGDAAHRCHPLAGQGVNLGFGDVECLKNTLVDAILEGGDIGAMVYLNEYESSRQRNVLPTLAVVDGLNRLYSNSCTPLIVLRALGLQATNAWSPIKKQIMQVASS